MKTRIDSPQRFDSGDGRVIYAVCLEPFPNFFANVYLIDDGDHPILVDTGSGWDASNQGLLDGLAEIEQRWGRRIRLDELACIVITHGHMDHFGGLSFVREHSAAPVAIHPLDRRVLTHYEERVVMAGQRLRTYLNRAGVSESRRDTLMRMYLAPKSRFRSQPVDLLLEEGKPLAIPGQNGEPIDLDLEVFHAPGHCPGQVCLRAGEVLLLADHVLHRTTPHQAPESITLNMGLIHYLDALAKIRAIALEKNLRLGLGGHEEPIEDIAGRIDEIRAAHDKRLDRTLEQCREPSTVADVSRGLFRLVHGYDVLLALEETGAHVEYLYHHGELVAGNLGEIEQAKTEVVRYVRA